MDEIPDFDANDLSVSTGQVRQEIREVGEAVFAGLSAISNAVIAETHRLRGYDRLDLDSFRALNRDHAVVFLGGIFRAQSPPRAPDREVMLDAATRRAELGIPLESVLEAITISQQHVWAECIRHARRLQTSAEALSQLGSILTSWIAELVRTAVETHRRLEQERVRAERHRRARLLEALVSAGATAADLALFETVGLTHDAGYLVVRGRARSNAGMAALERALGEEARAGGLAAILRGDACAALRRRPAQTGSPDAVLGVGPTVPLADLAASFVSATRALDTALAFGLSGAFAVDDLRLRVPIAADEEVGRGLVERYLDPLMTRRQSGPALEETLRAFLANGMRYESTARALVIHPNTLRYRLRRFEEITGADLHRIEDVVELWWALERQTVGRVSPASDRDQRPPL